MITYRGQKFAGYNKPKATPGESKKSAVLAKENGKVKLVLKQNRYFIETRYELII